MKWVKIREKIAATVAILLLFGMFCLISVKMGWNIPVVKQIGWAILGGSD